MPVNVVKKTLKLIYYKICLIHQQMKIQVNNYIIIYVHMYEPTGYIIRMIVLSQLKQHKSISFECLRNWVILNLNFFFDNLPIKKCCRDTTQTPSEYCRFPRIQDIFHNRLVRKDNKKSIIIILLNLAFQYNKVIKSMGTRVATQ